MKLSQINKSFWTIIIVLVATFLSIFGSLNSTYNQTAKASPLPLLNKFTFGFSNDVYPDYRNSTFGGASNAKLLSGPWFQTTWDAYGDEHTSWLSKFNEPANSDKTPYFYAYIAAGKAKSAYGLHDCNVASPDLCHQGANFIRANSSAITQGYTDFANKIKQIYGTTKPVVIHPDPDFYQYTANTQQNGGLTFAQIQGYMNQWTSAIKAVLPNSVLVMDISPWNNDIAGMASGLTNFDYAGLVGKRYPPSGVDGKTYAQISSMTGKKIILNDAHGVNGALMSYPYNWEDRITVQNAWNEGVVAVLMPGNNNTNSQLANTITSYTDNPIPSGNITTSSTQTSANSANSSTNSFLISSSNPTSSNNNSGRCFEVLATRQTGGNDWYNLELSLKNTAPTTLSNWELSFDLPFSQNLQSGWNNTRSQSGRTVNVSVSGSNINSNQTVSIGGLTINNASGNSTVLPSVFNLSPNICPVSSTTSSQVQSSIVSSQNQSSQVSSQNISSQNQSSTSSISQSSTNNQSSIQNSSAVNQSSQNTVSSTISNSSQVSSQNVSSAVSSQNVSSIVNSSTSSSVISSLVSSVIVSSQNTVSSAANQSSNQISSVVSSKVSSQNPSSTSTCQIVVPIVDPCPNGSSSSQNVSSVANNSQVSSQNTVSSSAVSSNISSQNVSSQNQNSAVNSSVVSSAFSSQSSNVSSSQTSSSSSNPTVIRDTVIDFGDGKNVQVQILNSDCRGLDFARRFSDENIAVNTSKFIEFKAKCNKTEIKTYWNGWDVNLNYNLVKYNPVRKLKGNNPYKAVFGKEWKDAKFVLTTTHIIEDNQDGDYSTITTEIWDPYTLESVATSNNGSIATITTKQATTNTITTPATTTVVNVANTQGLGFGSGLVQSSNLVSTPTNINNSNSNNNPTNNQNQNSNGNANGNGLVSNQPTNNPNQNTNQNKPKQANLIRTGGLESNIKTLGAFGLMIVIGLWFVGRRKEGKEV